MKAWVKLLLLAVLGTGVMGMLGGCTLTPHTSIGIDVDYHGGKFHVRPNAQVGVYGRP